VVVTSTTNHVQSRFNDGFLVDVTMQDQRSSGS